jgi:hypothetical protein
MAILDLLCATRNCTNPAVSWIRKVRRLENALSESLDDLFCLLQFLGVAFPLKGLSGCLKRVPRGLAPEQIHGSPFHFLLEGGKEVHKIAIQRRQFGGTRPSRWPPLLPFAWELFFFLPLSPWTAWPRQVVSVSLSVVSSSLPVIRLTLSYLSHYLLAVSLSFIHLTLSCIRLSLVSISVSVVSVSLSVIRFTLCDICITLYCIRVILCLTSVTFTTNKAEYLGNARSKAANKTRHVRLGTKPNACN